MAPNPYRRSFSFSGSVASNPNFVPAAYGSNNDAELDQVAGVTASIIGSLGIIQRSDGALQNGIVTTESMDPGLFKAFENYATIANTGATNAINAAGQAATSAASAASAATTAGNAATAAASSAGQAAASATAVGQLVGGQVGPALVTASRTRPVIEILRAVEYDLTYDIQKARAAPGFNGDDAPAINAIMAGHTDGCFSIPIVVKTPILLPNSNTHFRGIGGQQASPIIRDLSHTGDTMVVGSPTGGGPSAGGALIDCFFTHAGRISYQGGALPSLLNGGQSHLSIYGGQKAIIRGGGWGCQHVYSIFGGSGLSVEEVFTFGGVWNPSLPSAQEALSHLRLLRHPTYGQPTTTRIRGGDWYGGFLANQTYLSAGHSVTGQQNTGPQYNFLVNSAEDLTFEAPYCGFATVASVGLLPTPDAIIMANIQLIGGYYDEATIACVLARRDSDGAPMINSVKIKNAHINGQLKSLYGVNVNQSGADGNNRLAVSDFDMTGCTVSATQGTGVVLTGADGWRFVGNRVRGANTLNDATNNTLLNAGLYVGGLSQDGFHDDNVYGGGVNGQNGEPNTMKWGAIDVTPVSNGVSAQNNLYGQHERAAYVGNRSGYGALGQAGGATVYGGQAL